MKTARLFLKLCVLATLAVASTLFVAFGRAHSFNWRGWGAVNPFEAGTVGYTPVAQDGTYARFEVFTRNAYTECRWALRRESEHPRALQHDSTAGVTADDVPYWVPKDSGSATDHQLLQYGYVIDTAFGWPLRCLAARTTTEEVPLTDPQVARIAGRSLGEPVSQMKVLSGSFVSTMHSGWREYLYPDTTYWPTRVIWPGMLGNVVFYASLFAAPFVGWRTFTAARSAYRGRRGRCRGCGFDQTGLASDAPCPECGAVAARAEPKHIL